MIEYFEKKWHLYQNGKAGKYAGGSRPSSLFYTEKKKKIYGTVVRVSSRQ